MNKVEQIARIICEDADVLNGEPFQQHYVCETVTDCESCMAKARAAIAAMREPTDKMICAALDANDKGTRAYSDWWRAMIDAALSDEVAIRIPANPLPVPSE